MNVTSEQTGRRIRLWPFNFQYSKLCRCGINVFVACFWDASCTQKHICCGWTGPILFSLLMNKDPCAHMAKWTARFALRASNKLRCWTAQRRWKLSSFRPLLLRCRCCCQLAHHHSWLLKLDILKKDNQRDPLKMPDVFRQELLFKYEGE